MNQNFPRVKALNLFILRNQPSISNQLNKKIALNYLLKMNKKYVKANKRKMMEMYQKLKKHFKSITLSKINRKEPKS